MTDELSGAATPVEVADRDTGKAGSEKAGSDRTDTLVGLLDRARHHPDTGLRLLDRRERETWLGWDEIARRARRTAARLEALGVAPGERVALVFPTGAEFFEAFFGILAARAVPVPLYPPVRLGRIEEYHQRTAAMLEAAGAVLVLTESRIRRILGPTITEARPRHGCQTLDALPTVEHSVDLAEVATALSADDLGLVQFSSGTTVAPKPVALSHRAMLAQVQGLNGFWPDDDQTRHSGVSWLPLYHDMGLIGCVFPALERPGVLTLLGPEVFVARPSLWLRALSKTRATISVAPNFAYGLCVEKVRDEELDGVDLSHWRVALNGAEPVAPSVLRAFQERFARWGFRPEALTPVYGLSEATLAVTFSQLFEPFRAVRFDRERLAEGQAVAVDDGVELVSVGRPLPGTEIRLRGDDGQVLDEGSVGEVWVRGPSLMTAYLDCPEATAKTLQNGWLATGDLGFVYDGDLFLTSRAKDVVIMRGRNHAPAEIEQAVDGVEGVRTGCVVAASHLPEGGSGEELLLFVEARQGTDVSTLEGLPIACREAVLAATQLKTDRVVVLAPGTLPRTSSGKLRRGEALRQFLAGELAPPDRVTPLHLAKIMLRSAVAYARRPSGQEPAN